MRPVSLSLDGFTSYGEPTVIYLEPHYLTAITGRNGAGKTSVVDAILFALFGQGRVDGDIDAIVTTDADKAAVAFEFELNDRLWRASRTRIRGKRSTALLECQDEAGVWQARSNGTVRDTDNVICALLGMSADTFLSTVIIGQGDADRFCAADPAERKIILGEVLRLSQYGRYAERSKDRLSTARATVAATHQRVEALEIQVAALDSVRAESAAAEAAKSDIHGQLIGAETTLATATAAEAAAAEATEAAAEAERRLGRAREAAEARTAEAQRRSTDAAQRRDRNASRVTQARAQLSATEAAAARAKALEGEALGAERAASEAAAREEEIVGAGQQARESLVGIDSLIAQTTAERAQLEERREGLAKAVAEASAETGSASAACWICEQPLTADHARRMLDDLDREIADSTTRHQQLAAERARAQARVEQLKSEYRTTRAAKEAATATATARRSDAERAKAEAGLLPGMRERLAEAEADLAEAVSAVAQAAAEVASTTAPDPEIEAATAELARLRQRFTDADKLRTARGEAEERVRILRKALSDAERTVGSLAERVATLERAAAELAGLASTMTRQQVEEKDWTALTRAFGRDGIPSMVVASAVPELEEQTNLLLADLSAGALSVKLSTTRQTKTGTSKDTLDITVIGPDGERRYDSYSGGERLRIDVAIRLGLSQMLANRSGTSIKLLIIDEGWGPLDADGVPALIDCLRVLQESGRFCSVFTITHLPEVASAFPQQITIDRGPDGFSVVETAA